MSSENNIGMSGGTNHGGIVIGKNSGKASIHNAPGTISNTEIRDCTNVTKVGDVNSTNVNIGGGAAPSSSSNNGPRTSQSQDRESNAVHKHTVGMSDGVNNRGTVIGENTGQVDTHNAPAKVSNTKVYDSRNVTTVNDVTGDNVTIGGSGANTNPTGREGQPSQKSQERDIEDYTVTDVKELLKKERFPETVVTNFENSGIDGKFFMGLMEEGVLKELGVQSALDQMKIRKLVEKFQSQK